MSINNKYFTNNTKLNTMLLITKRISLLDQSHKHVSFGMKYKK